MGIIILLNFLYQVLLIIITSIVTAYFSNRGQYKREKKLRDGRYLEEALNKVYSPLYNIIMTDAYTPRI